MGEGIAQCKGVNEKEAVAHSPLVSIITPVFNGIKYLETCIQSVLNQSYPYVEHVIVDGGSTDGTVDVLSSYSEASNRIRFISEPDKNAADAMNKGTLMSKGDILGWLGADDVFEQNAIMTVVNFFRENQNASFLFGDCNFINEEGEIIGKFLTKDFDLGEAINDGCHIPTPSAFYRRDVIRKVGLWDTRINSTDLDFWIRAGMAFQIHRIRKVLSNFRLYKESITGSKKAGIMYAREGIIISKRYGGNVFSAYRRYLRLIIIEPLRPVLGPVYPFVKEKVLKNKLPAKLKNDAIFTE